MTNREKFIGGPTGGIPESVFQSGLNKKLFYGQSGKTRLRCTTQPNLLEIEDYYEPKLHFSSYIETEPFISISAKNTGWLGDNQQKHPDIFPFLLLKRSLKYFIEQGYHIKGIQAQWQIEGHLTDNYKQFLSYLNKLGKKKYTTADLIDAAKSTKTAFMAEQFGFTEVEIPQQAYVDNTPVVITIFRKI